MHGRSRRNGYCTQGCGGAASHTKSLYHSYDFDLPIGTPVLAAQDGTVVALCHEFQGSGMTPKFKARANYVILYHESLRCFSRYYHLHTKSVRVRVGDDVKEGEVLGMSGMTGYTNGPHLHFDLVDFCIFSYARVAICLNVSLASPSTSDKLEASSSAGVASSVEGGTDRINKHNAESTNAADESWHELHSCVASFSGPIPDVAAGGQPIRGRLQWADPPTASCNPLRNTEILAGSIAIVERCGYTDFLDKALRAEEAGAIAVIIINNEDGPAIHVCARPKGSDHTLSIPVMMVTKREGNRLCKNGGVCQISQRTSFTKEGGADLDGRLGALSSKRSTMREAWHEYSERPFSEYEPVTMGPICFSIPQIDSNGPAIEWPDPKAGQGMPSV